MSDDDPMVDGRLLSTLKVTELREELERYHLPTKGVKKDLQQRLKEHLAEKKATTVESPIVAEYRAKQQLALAQARAADPRNKPQISEDQVSSSKPADVSPQKPESLDEKPAESVAEPEKVVENKQKEDAVVEEEKKAQESSESGSNSTSSSSSSREASTEPAAEVAAEEESIAVKPVAEPVRAPETEVPAAPAVIKAETDSQKESKSETPKASLAKEHNSPKTAIKEEPMDTTPSKPVSDIVVGKKTKEEEPQRKEEDVSTKAAEAANKEDDGDELDYGDDERDIKDDTVDNGEEESMVTESKDEEKEKTPVKKDEKDRKERESIARRRASSPNSRHPVSEVIHIRGLVRPFTENMLRNLISSHGGEIEDFWIDKVKSHCFAKMSSIEKAADVLKALNGTKWPESNPKLLSIVHDSEDNMQLYKDGKGEVKLPEVVAIGTITGASRAERLSSASSTNITGKTNLRITVENAIRDNTKRDVELKEKRGSLASRLTRVDDKDKDKKEHEKDRKRKRSETPPFSRGAGFLDEKRGRLDDRVKMRDDRRVSEKDEPAMKTPDELFKKTKFLPALYFQPLTEQQVTEKQKKASSSKGEGKRKGESLW